jgi:two-component system, chemotaxis family, chemotaxis protein CheY
MTISDMKILISDDSILVRKKIKDHLTSLGCKNIIEASDGEEAVELYKKNSPDLVFLDIVMPKKDGVSALLEIMAFDNNAKVVIASSVGTQGNLKAAIEAGAFDFLQKPISPDNVTKIVHNIMHGVI